MRHDQVVRFPGPAPCDNEQIQFLNQIQPSGFLLEVSPDWVIVRVSDNIDNFLPLDVRAALGAQLQDVIGHRAVHDVRGELQIIGLEGGIRKIYDVTFDIEGRRDRIFDISVMRQGESIFLECEPSVAADGDVAMRMQSLLGQLRAATDVELLCQRLTAHIRSLCGYDRVMIYQFHEDLTGEVVAERRGPNLNSFMGLRFPASDIPAQARLLYLRNPLRVIADVFATNATLMPKFDHSGAMADLSMVSLRAVSPVHLEYLRNMGVSASMSISLVVDGKLWGLVACHHSSPRRLSLKVRTTLEFYGQMASSLLEALIRGKEIHARKRAREIHTRLLSLISSNADGEDNMFTLLSELRSNLHATGMAVLMDGRIRSEGSVPSPEGMAALIRFLNGTPVSEVYVTNCLMHVCRDAFSVDRPVAGVLAVPISRTPRDYVMYFRDEVVTEVKWAGKPEKGISADGSHYTPRNSFATWKNLVRGQSAQWGPLECEKGEALRITLLEVMLRLTDSAEKMRKQSNEQQDTLIAELNHRVRNILNLIVGLVRQCGDTATSVTSFMEDVSSRIYALARAHDQLTSSGWRPRSLHNMVRVEAGAYLGSKAERVIIFGGDCAIEADAFATLALVFHELITNSAKYGAFKDSHGRAELAIEQSASGELLLRWSEHDGAVVTAPRRRGFGSTIIERAVPHELGGKAAMEFAPSGLIVTLEIPARYVTSCAPTEELKRATSESTVSNFSIAKSIENVLLVEDNLMIALETEANLLAIGARTVHVASTVTAALDALRQFRPDFAILDYNLGRENSLPIAERLSTQGIPFVFATGYGDTNAVDARYRDNPIITKPYDVNSLMQHMVPAQASR